VDCCWLVVGSCDRAALADVNRINKAQRNKAQRLTRKPEKLRSAAPLIRHPGAPPIS
jgi:hypothetical protein